MNRINWLILVLVFAGLLMSCGGEEEPPEPGPEDGAKEWIDASVNLDGNRMLKHTCKAQRDNIKGAGMWTSAFMVLAQTFTTRSVEIEGDVSDLKFETISQSDNQAEVRVYGELRVAVLGNAEAHEVDDRWQMIYENDTWRWCGSDAIIRIQIINAINTINTFRYASTGQEINRKENNILVPFESEVEIIEPGKMRLVKRYENGDTTETIAVDDRRCFRSNNEPWECSDTPVPLGSFTDSLVKIVEGQPLYGDWIVTEHGSRLDVREDKECRLYYLTTLFQGEGYEIEWTYEYCFDLITNYPVQLAYVYKKIVDGEIKETFEGKNRHYDFNSFIEITLPTP